MKTLFLFLSVILFTTACSRSPESEDIIYTGNPLFDGWYADPASRVYDDTYWIFPTYSDYFHKQVYFDAFSSPDLVNWTKHERIIDSSAVQWADSAMWAPASIKKDDKYYFFFVANDVHEGEVGGIGVAVSDRPEGPFEREVIIRATLFHQVSGPSAIKQALYHRPISTDQELP